jgi:hypothetical protein
MLAIFAFSLTEINIINIEMKCTFMFSIIFIKALNDTNKANTEKLKKIKINFPTAK